MHREESCLGIAGYPDQLSPEDNDVVLSWRFMELPKFRNWMTSKDLYVCCADLFND